MNERLSILLVGVGGQGVLGTGRRLGEAASHAGLVTTVAALHGMSQRGGSVECSVLLGPGHGSFPIPGGVDVVVAFEPLEALRVLERTSERTRVILSTATVAPSSLARSGKSYPDVGGIVAELRRRVSNVVVLDAAALAKRAGDRRALGAVMLGALCATGAIPIGSDTLSAEMGSEPARKAFALGAEAVS